MEDKKVDLFLDSGAFSAWTQGASININEYIQFIKDNKDFIDIYANLDVIAGIKDKDGRMLKQPSVETAEATLANQKIMEKAGLHPIPCFHFGEPEEYLKYYVDNYYYIALGVAGNSGMKLKTWLNRCFSKFICDEKGMPKVKVHGFAVTSVRIMIAYPWYSVDSTSWVVSSRMGAIFVPKWINGKWDYETTPDKVLFSNRSPYAIKDKEVDDMPAWDNETSAEKGKHFSTLKPLEKETYIRYLEEKGYKVGYSTFTKVSQDHELTENEKWSEKRPKDKNASREMETIVEKGICNIYQQRDELNIIYFLDLEKSRPAWPWAFNLNIQNSLL